MPRISRVVAIGLPHHITQRGNYSQDTFLDDTDRKQYLTWVQEYCNKFKTSILVYCLMPNHIHFIAIPETEDSLAKTFSSIHMRYSQYFNKKINSKGHLWQGRFYSCVLDDKHLIAAARYIERNPVRAGIVEKPWYWKWSSASHHIGESNGSYINLKNLFETIEITSEDWRQFIDFEDNIKIIKNIRKYTLAGRPLGSEEFIKTLEQKFNKKLNVLKRGRPFKKTA